MKAVMAPVISFVLIILISGCGTVQNQAKTQEFLRTIPVCYSDRECEMKWSAARTWVLKNSGWKIQTITPDFIETYNSIGGSPALAVRVVKEPIQTGGYKIIVKTWCDNMFGCVPDSQDSELHFNRYLNATKY